MPPRSAAHLPRIGHILVGLIAFYHAIASLTQAFTGEPLLPLGRPLLMKQPSQLQHHASVAMHPHH